MRNDFYGQSGNDKGIAVCLLQPCCPGNQLILTVCSCLDFQRVNAISCLDAYTVSQLDDLSGQLGKGCY